jgi:CheY-like chemotaxis protein
VQQSAAALLVLINDILDFSKIEAGRLDIETVPFSLRTMIDRTLKPLAPRAAAKQIALRANVHPGVPDALVGDPLRIRQVLLNLVSNAIKFTSEGEVVVSVMAGLSSASHANLQISVADTGIGIPAAKQATIFQAFTQADGSTTRRYGGTGLGLAVCMKLVKLMGGSLWLNSKPGVGSAFHFTLQLPLSDVPSDRDTTEPDTAGDEVADDNQSAAPAVRPTRAARALRVLVAEDNPVNQRLTQHLLERRGHQALLVSNGREAIAQLASQRFDLVLMDLQMPEMDGFEATAAIREAETRSGTRVPIVALTAHAMRGDRQRCLDADMDGYVSKPIRAFELFEVIDTVVAARATQAV